jgi:hypothetical protein
MFFKSLVIPFAFLAVMAFAVALVAMFTASPAANELDGAVRLGWWFC